MRQVFDLKPILTGIRLINLMVNFEITAILPLSDYFPCWICLFFTRSLLVSFPILSVQKLKHENMARAKMHAGGACKVQMRSLSQENMSILDCQQKVGSRTRLGGGDGLQGFPAHSGIHPRQRTRGRGTGGDKTRPDPSVLIIHASL